MNVDERIIRGHFGLDSARRLKVSVENPQELRIVIDHEDGSAHIALQATEARKLRDTLTEWLERGRQAPLAAGRRPTIHAARKRRRSDIQGT